MDVPPRRRRGREALAIGLFTLLALWVVSVSRSAPRLEATSIPRPSEPRPPELGRPSDLPRSSGMTVPQFESKLFAFLNARRYVELGWHRDKAVRDTGPYING